MNKFLALSLLLVAAPVLAEENAPAAEATEPTRAIEVAPEAPAQKKQVEADEATRSAEVTPEASAANQESN